MSTRFDDQLRLHIRSLIREERVSKEKEPELHEFGVRVSVMRKMNISDILTDLRILLGVAVVTQDEPAHRTPGGDTVLLLTMRYVPSRRAISPLSRVRELATVVKRVKGIKKIRVDTFDGNNILIHGKSAVF